MKTKRTLIFSMLVFVLGLSLLMMGSPTQSNAGTYDNAAQRDEVTGYLDAYIQSQYVAGPDVLGLGDGDNEYGFIYDPQAYKDTVDNDGGLPGDGTVCGVGDDMADRPVLVDNLMGTNTLIPGTSIRNVWNNASTAYGGMSATVVSALRNKVIAHREAGFNTDIAIY